MGVAAPLLRRSRLLGGLPGLPPKPPRIPATPFRFALYKTAGWIAFTLGILSCLWLHPTPPAPSVFDSGRTAYGFFPAPPDVDFFSGIAIYGSIAEHGDVVMIQQGVAWDEFREGPEGESKKMNEIRGQVDLAWRNGLEPIFIVDPLNGMDRTQFAGLPPDLAGADFGDPAVRSAITNYAVRIAHDYHPRYLGLASEINTYADAFPEDFPNFLSLYRETYRKIKKESPSTRVFVTFQWEDLNNLDIFGDGQGPYLKWDLIEAFEPELDIWAISSYPFVAFDTAADIPDDYYTPLLDRTDKPLAVAEGGFGSVDLAPFHGTPQDQTGYLQAIHGQIGGRLAFWIYLLLDDLNMESYGKYFADHGQAEMTETMRWFSVVGLRSSDGVPKEALAVWDGFRN
jgi:hypothetical protein